MEKVRREKMQVRKKVGKSRNTVFFPVFCGSGGSKSRLVKVAGADVAVQMRDEKLHIVLVRSTFGSKKKHVRFGGLLKVEMLKKNASHGGGKHIWKSKYTKHTSSGPLLDVVKSKKCTPLWCKAHLEVKTYKTPGVRTPFLTNG